MSFENRCETWASAKFCLRRARRGSELIEGFREEREWRAIYIPMVRSSPLMKSSVETVGGVPQTVYQIPLDASFDPAVSDLDIGKILDRVIIGPTQYPLAMQKAFRTKVMEAGCCSEVVMSKIPLRT